MTHTMENQEPERSVFAPALVLACGNTLRGDDGVAWQIASLLADDPLLQNVEVILSQQFLPEHSEPLSRASVVVFIDCSALTAAGKIAAERVEAATELPRIMTHHLDPASLLRIALDLYGRIPAQATVVTVGGESFEFGAELSPVVAASVEQAANAVREMLVQLQVSSI